MERKGDDTLRAQDLETSLDISNLLYLENKESNVVVERTQKIQYADRPVNKAEDVLVINFQTGSDYISFKDSHLRLVLNLFKQDKTTPSVDADAITFGVWGSVLGVMRTIRIISRAGDVIAQVDSANLLNFYKVNYEHKERWKFQQGKALIGWTSSTGEHLQGTNEFLIPLQLICSFFECHELAPAMLCRGMRMEITLENPAVAFVQPTPGQAADTLGTYTVTGCQLHLDSYSLTSGAVNWLNDRSANNGLVMTYYDWENSHGTKNSGVSNYSYEVRKTASMANCVWTTFRKSADTNLLTANSFAGAEIKDTDQFQYRVSSLYLPVQPLVGIKSAYQQLNYTLDRLRSGEELGTTLGSFGGAGGNGLGILSAILDRYWLEGSGLAINNSTTLTISGENDPTDAKDVDIFLKHTRSLTVYLQNIRRSD